MDLVNQQILRFAGEETFSPTTIIHWAMTRTSAFSAVVRAGCTSVDRWFLVRRQGAATTSITTWTMRCPHICRNKTPLWISTAESFSRQTIYVATRRRSKKIVPALEIIIKDPNRAEIIDIVTHEQYFWPFLQKIPSRSRPAARHGHPLRPPSRATSRSSCTKDSWAGKSRTLSSNKLRLPRER